MARSRHTRSRKQRGGSSPYTGGYGNYSYTGPAGVAAGGVPFESRGANNEHCGWNYRPAPQLGGASRKKRRGGRKQRGGSCGCGVRQMGGSRRQQRGGGGGTGGYGVDVTNNSLGPGNYVTLTRGPCPATPVANQLGGASDHELLGIDSYPAGYGFSPHGVVSTNSAHYLDPIGYDRSCKGGARRTKKRKARRSHKSF